MGQWPSEALFLASIAGAYQVAFAKAASKSHLEFTCLKVRVSCISCIQDGVVQMADILLKPLAGICRQKDMDDALQQLYLCQKRSAVLNSVRSRIHIFPSVFLDMEQ